MKRIRELDGLRGIAVSLVVLGHYLHHPRLAFWGPQWGWMGVNLFFVLSGFLITSILLRMRREPGALSVFYLRRAWRIFPVYYLALAVYFLASAHAGTPQPWNTTTVYLLFLQAILPAAITHLRIVPHPAWVIMGFSVLWTLSVEELFYLLWAPLVVFTQRRRTLLLRFLILILLITPFVRFFYPDPRGIQEMFLGQMDSLAAGAVLAFLWMDHAETLRPWTRKHAAQLYMACIALIGCVIWIDLATGIPYKTPFHMRLFNAPSYTLLWVAWCAFLLATLACSGTAQRMPRLLRSRLLCWLGKISYCLYVVHYSIFLFWRSHLPHSVALPVALASSLAVSELSWRLLEGPIARWKQRHFQNGEPVEPVLAMPSAK